MAGYGDPVPCDGIESDDAGVLFPYVGTSLRTRSSGTVGPVVCGKGEGEGVDVCRWFKSELFDRADEDRWREVILLSTSVVVQSLDHREGEMKGLSVNTIDFIGLADASVGKALAWKSATDCGEGSPSNAV